MKYITVNKDLIRIPQSKSANMEVLLLYYIRTKCNKECASAIGEKKMQEELNLSESTVEGYIGKLKEYKSILSIKTLNPNNEEDKKKLIKFLVYLMREINGRRIYTISMNPKDSTFKSTVYIQDRY